MSHYVTKSVEELKLLCKEAGIKGYSKLTKRELVEALIDDVAVQATLTRREAEVSRREAEVKKREAEVLTREIEVWKMEERWKQMQKNALGVAPVPQAQKQDMSKEVQKQVQKQDASKEGSQKQDTSKEVQKQDTSREGSQKQDTSREGVGGKRSVPPTGFFRSFS